MPRKDSMRGRKSRFSAAGAIKRRFYQHIRAASKQMPFGRPCPSRTKNLERFQAKWTPVRVKKTRQIKNLELRFDSIEAEKALDRDRRIVLLDRLRMALVVDRDVSEIAVGHQNGIRLLAPQHPGFEVDGERGL